MSKKPIPYVLTAESVALVIDGDPTTIVNTNPTYFLVKKAIEEERWDEIAPLVVVRERLKRFAEGEIEVKRRQIFYKGKSLSPELSQYIVWLDENDEDVKPALTFIDNLMENPSDRAVDELFSFMQHGNMPITHDGMLLAYKVVTNDYMDCRTGTMDNSIGSTVSMPREDVDDDKHRTCSSGLHFCSRDYIKAFHSSGNRLMIVKIHPKDVVSIPADYQNTKGRCCEFKVIGELDYDEFESDWSESSLIKRFKNV